MYIYVYIYKLHVRSGYDCIYITCMYAGTITNSASAYRRDANRTLCVTLRTKRAENNFNGVQMRKKPVARCRTMNHSSVLYCVLE